MGPALAHPGGLPAAGGRRGAARRRRAWRRTAVPPAADAAQFTFWVAPGSRLRLPHSSIRDRLPPAGRALAAGMLGLDQAIYGERPKVEIVAEADADGLDLGDVDLDLEDPARSRMTVEDPTDVARSSTRTPATSVHDAVRHATFSCTDGGLGARSGDGSGRGRTAPGLRGGRPPQRAVPADHVARRAQQFVVSNWEDTVCVGATRVAGAGAGAGRRPRGGAGRRGRRGGPGASPARQSLAEHLRTWWRERGHRAAVVPLRAPDEDVRRRA